MQLADDAPVIGRHDLSTETNDFVRSARRWLTGNRMLETAAGSTTVVGMWIGTNSPLGAVIYGASLLLFWALTLRTRMWGLVPMQIGLTVVAVRALVLSFV